MWEASSCKAVNVFLGLPSHLFRARDFPRSLGLFSEGHKRPCSQLGEMDK